MAAIDWKKERDLGDGKILKVGRTARNRWLWNLLRDGAQVLGGAGFASMKDAWSAGLENVENVRGAA